MTHRVQAAEGRSARRSAAAFMAAVAAICLAAMCLTACTKVAAPAEAAAAGPLTQTPDGRALQLVFEDQFDSLKLHRDGQGVWRTVFRDGVHPDPFELRTLSGNKELQLYVDPDMALETPVSGEAAAALNPFATRNGMLEILARPAPPGLAEQLGGFRYVSGMISTQPSFSQTYGYFEIRAKLPRGKGLWPAFWLLPLDLSWPPEIDVIESIGDPAKVWTTAHSNHDKVPGVTHEISADGFHVFAVSWDEWYLVWYIDGREVSRQPTPRDMHKPMYMIANLAVGGTWPGSPNAATRFPARLTIDYIRAYKFA